MENAMGNWLARVLVLYFLNIFCLAYAEDTAALFVGARSFQLTPMEKALFTEASDRFKKYEILKNTEIYAAFWLDNDRLAFSSRKYPGWEAKPNEMSRVITYNINTGVIADSGYRGKLHCLNHLGDMLLAQSERESHGTVRMEGYQWLAGKWGQSLSPINYFSHSFIPNYLCNFAPYGDDIYATPPEIQPPGFSMITPLLPNHGAIENTVIKIEDWVEDRVHLIKPDGQKIFLSKKRLSRFNFIYQPWDDTYFEVRVAPAESRNIYPAGSIRKNTVPRLFLAWQSRISSSITPFPSKKGVIWHSQQMTGYWRKQGIFLETNTGLIRIEEGEPSGDIITSPDGCKIFAWVVRGDPSISFPRKYTRVVIDLCMENIN
jgi:hypothetical protein